MSGPARITLLDGGVFVADHAELDGEVLTAKGGYKNSTRLAEPVVRSWNMRQVKVIRWGPSDA